MKSIATQREQTKTRTPDGNRASSHASLQYLLSFVLLAISAGTSLQAETFNVLEHGAKGDGQHDDAPAIRSALGKACRQGGTVYLPGPGTYLVRVSDPARQPGLISAGLKSWCVFPITSDHVRIFCEPGTQLKVVTDFIPKEDQTTPGGTRVTLFHFSRPSGRLPFVRDFHLQGGRFTWEADGAKLASGEAWNHWSIRSGSVVDSLWRDAVFDGFPQGGLNGGVVEADGKQREHSRYANCSFLNWGGALHDSLFYVQGDTAFENCLFRTTRPEHSHAVYIGGDRPGLRIADCVFDGVGGSRGMPLHLYGQAGGDIEDIEVRNSRFVRCNPALIGHEGKAVKNAVFQNLQFTGGGLLCKRVSELRVADCKGGSLGCEDCHDVIVRDCLNMPVSVSGANPSTHVTIRGCNFTRKSENSGSQLVLGSVRSCLVQGCLLDVGSTNDWGVYLTGKAAASRDVVIQNNMFVRQAGGTPLLYIEKGIDIRNVTIAENSFRFASISGAASSVEAQSGDAVTIRGNSFNVEGAANESPNTVVIGTAGQEPIPGSFHIDGNVERTDAPRGLWKLNARDVTLVNNTIAHGHEGKVRESNNRVSNSGK